jgi:hypothetical protein
MMWWTMISAYIRKADGRSEYEAKCGYCLCLCRVWRFSVSRMVSLRYSDMVRAKTEGKVYIGPFSCQALHRGDEDFVRDKPNPYAHTTTSEFVDHTIDITRTRPSSTVSRVS